MQNIENRGKALDGENIGYGVFVDLQTAFDIVEHQDLITMRFLIFEMIGANPIWLIKVSMYP